MTVEMLVFARRWGEWSLDCAPRSPCELARGREKLSLLPEPANNSNKIIIITMIIYFNSSTLLNVIVTYMIMNDTMTKYKLYILKFIAESSLKKV